jgi:predicted alpha/beta hydrolase family esterase
MRSAGIQVWYPQFPAPDNPSTADWQELVSAESQLMDEVAFGEKIAVTHSLGCLNWLLAARDGILGDRFDRVVWVAPPDPELLEETTGRQFNLSEPKWRDAIRQGTNSLTIVASDEDRWLPRGIVETYGETLGMEPLIIDGAAHFSLQDGWGPWPGMFRWISSGEIGDLARQK